MSARNGTSWSGRCEDLTNEEYEWKVVSRASTGRLRSTTWSCRTRPARSCWPRRLVRLNVELVAIERPDGVLVERLLDAGLRVLALHPNQVAAARARFRVSGGKSDRFDAFVLCELARTDHHRFRVLEPDSDQTKALRALCRAREDLVQTRVALTNQLRAELERFWPGAVKIFRSIDSPIALAFLEKYPSPIEAKTLGEERLAAFLARRHYSGGKTPAELLRKLRSAPEGRAGELEIRTRRQLVLALVALLGPLVTQIKQLERQIAQALDEHPDGELFRPLFRDRKSVITRALPDRRCARRRRRPGRGRDRVRQAQGRLLPLGVQQALARRVLHAGRQHSPLAPLGRRPLRQSDRPRPRPPPRDPRPRPRVVPRAVALLARPHPIRPRPPPRPATACPGDDPRIVGLPARPSRHPADARRNRHPKGGPKGRAQRA